MRFFLLPIVLGFPILEIWLMISLFGQYGWAFLAYLILVAFLGYRLLQDEKMMMLGRFAQTLRTGQTPASAMFSSFKNIIAGIFLIIPGVITDAIAILLLFLPSPKPITDTHNQAQNKTKNSRAANDDVIEGEFTRED